VLVEAERPVGADAFFVAIKAAFDRVFLDVVRAGAALAVASALDGVMASPLLEEQAVLVGVDSEEVSRRCVSLPAGAAGWGSLRVRLRVVAILGAEKGNGAENSLAGADAEVETLHRQS
jgi:hypothetical protein